MELASAVGGSVHAALHPPLRALARAARKAPPLWPPEATLPVAGLDALAAQSIHYALRRLEGVSAAGWRWRSDTGGLP
jgi:hypothetical protein